MLSTTSNNIQLCISQYLLSVYSISNAVLCCVFCLLLTDSIHRWDIHKGEAKHTLRGHTSAVTSVAILARGTIITASGDHTLRLWRHGIEVQVVREHESEVAGVAVGAEESRAVTVSTDTTVRVWSLGTPSEC